MIDEPPPLKGLFDHGTYGRDAWSTWVNQMTRAMNTVVAQQSQVLAMLANITTLIQQERKTVMATQQTLTDLQTAVTENANAIASATQAFQMLAEQIKAASASDDDQAVEALAQKLHEQAGELAAAVVANTPAAPNAPAAAPPADQTNPAPPADDTTQPQPAPMQAKAPQHDRGKHK